MISRDYFEIPVLSASSKGWTTQLGNDWFTMMGGFRPGAAVALGFGVGG